MQPGIGGGGILPNPVLSIVLGSQRKVEAGGRGGERRGGGQETGE